MPRYALLPRLVVTTTPARPPYSALYEFDSTCISDDGVEAGRRVADRAEDRVGRGLAVLDVRHAVGLAAQELDVGRRCRPRRSGSAAGTTGCRGCLRGRSWSCCSSRPRAIGLAVERDVVDRVGGDGHRLAHAAHFERDVHQRGAAPRARRTPVCSNFLKFGVTTSTRYVPGLRLVAS